ncbi:MAG: hypothetical protein J5639_09220 [Bacteroidales bacterium]|nr:hypothetical protein [Bacteroidales bacterium]
MTTEEIIAAFDAIKKSEPKRFYNALGYSEPGQPVEEGKIDYMHPFFDGSYEVGLVIGARYALDHFVKQPHFGKLLSRIFHKR